MDIEEYVGSYPVFEKVSLLTFLSNTLSVSKSQAKKILDSRRILVNGKRVWMAKHELKPHDAVKIVSGVSNKKQISRWSEKFVILENKNFLVINKPANILAAEEGGIISLSEEHRGKKYLPVHRLDKETSGALIVAKDEESRNALVELFKNHQVAKEYLAIVAGVPRFKTRKIDFPLEGKDALTNVTVVDKAKDASLLLVEIETGRTHQIRKHLSQIRLPVLGDKKYLTRRKVLPFEENLERQMLHAFSLTFKNPFNGKLIAIKAPIPADFKECLVSLSLPVPVDN